MKRLFSTRTSESAFSFAMFVLRLGTGSLILMNHGMDKLIHFSQKAGAFADPFGIGSTASLALDIFAEFFCSIFIILGLFTRLACIPLIIAMVIFGQGELAGLFLIVFSTILFAGPGRLSLDRFLVK